MFAWAYTETQRGNQRGKCGGGFEVCGLMGLVVLRLEQPILGIYELMNESSLLKLIIILHPVFLVLVCLTLSGTDDVHSQRWRHVQSAVSYSG